jgi:hypothetical protein
VAPGGAKLANRQTTSSKPKFVLVETKDFRTGTLAVFKLAALAV